MRVVAVVLFMCSCCAGQVAFDGSTNYIYCGTYEKAPPYTFSAWIYTRELNSTDNIIMGQQYNRQFDFNNGTELRLYDDFGSPKSFTFPIQSNDVLNVWLHVGATVSASNVCLYMNGDCVTNIALTAYSGGVTSLYIGAGNYLGTMVRHFNGTIDDARAYTRVLSPVEFAEIYAKPWVLADDPDLVVRTCIPGRWNETLIADVSGTNHAAVNHGVELSQTMDGWSGAFDGVNDYIETGMMGPLGASDRTFTAWVKTTNTVATYNMIAYYGANVAGGRFWWDIEPNESLGFRIHTGYVVFDAAGIADDHYHHVAVVVHSSSLLDVAMYMDGTSLTLLSSNTANAINTGSSHTIAIGAEKWAGAPLDFFDGSIRSETVYDQALTSDDINALATGGTITNTPLAQWSMQPTHQNTGSTLSGVALNLGSGTDGAYKKGPTVAPGMIRHSEPRHRVANRRKEYNTVLIRDMSGSGHTATNHGAELYETSAGWVGSFDGVGDYARATVPNLTTNDITCEASFELDSYDAAGCALVYMMRPSSPYDGFSLICYSNETAFSFQVNNSSASYRAHATNVISLGVKTHLAFTVDRSDTSTNSLILFIDGEKVPIVWDLQVGTLAGSVGNENCVVGALHNATDRFFDGLIDGLSIYYTLLSDAAIFTLSRGGAITNQAAVNWTMRPEYR